MLILIFLTFWDSYTYVYKYGIHPCVCYYIFYIIYIFTLYVIITNMNISEYIPSYNKIQYTKYNIVLYKITGNFYYP